MNNGCFDLTRSAFHILKAGYDTDRSDIAELVEDAEDLQAFNERANEETISFEKVLNDLKNNGKI